MCLCWVIFCLGFDHVGCAHDSPVVDGIERRVVFLIKHLQLRSAAAALAIIGRFYPHHLVPPKTQFLLEELYDKI